MNEHTRRTFLIGTGTAAAVGTAAAAGAVPAAAAAAPDSEPGPTRPPGESSGPVVAYVSDAESGQVTVMRGDDEVVLTDHALARRLTGQVR